MKEIVGGEETFVNERAPKPVLPTWGQTLQSLPDPHGATTRRAFRTGTRSATTWDALSRIASYERDRKEEIVEELI